MSYKGNRAKSQTPPNFTNITAVGQQWVWVYKIDLRDLWTTPENTIGRVTMIHEGPFVLIYHLSLKGACGEVR